MFYLNNFIIKNSQFYADLIKLREIGQSYGILLVKSVE